MPVFLGNRFAQDSYNVRGRRRLSKKRAPFLVLFRFIFLFFACFKHICLKLDGNVQKKQKTTKKMETFCCQISLTIAAQSVERCLAAKGWRYANMYINRMETLTTLRGCNSRFIMLNGFECMYISSSWTARICANDKNKREMNSVNLHHRICPIRLPEIRGWRSRWYWKLCFHRRNNV